MQSDGLETDKVVARRHRRRNRGGPRRVVGDHLARSPGSVEDSAREQTRLVDLEPLEVVRVDTRAGRAGALSKVSELQVKCETQISLQH